VDVVGQGSAGAIQHRDEHYQTPPVDDSDIPF
jgi:hypothetical protein